MKPALPYGEDIVSALSALEHSLRKERPALLEQYPSRWLLLKLLEQDQVVLKETNPTGSNTTTTYTVL